MMIFHCKSKNIFGGNANFWATSRFFIDLKPKSLQKQGDHDTHGCRPKKPQSGAAPKRSPANSIPETGNDED